MSMSTKIDDLPGPLDNDIINDLSQIQNDMQNDHRHINNQYIDHLNESNSNQSNIKMDIKKKVHFREPLEDDKSEIENDKDLPFFEYIKSQINEENLLIFLMLIVVTRSELDQYTKTLPVVGIYAESSNIISTIIKCFIILLIFIFAKKYFLPSIKL